MAENKPDEKKNNEEQVQVEIARSELPCKHPLHNTWTLWYFEKQGGRNWEENQRQITSISFVEDFWSLYNHILVASELRSGCDYSFFKQGIKPMWEDDANKQGGRWLISLDKRQRETDLDRYWLEVLLCMVGEAFDEYSDEVCGAVVNVRPRGDKIALWTSHAKHSQVVMEIGRRLKDRLNLGPSPLGYQLHDDTANKSGSITKNLYTI